MCTLDLRTLSEIRHDRWREITRGKAVVTHWKAENPGNLHGGKTGSCEESDRFSKGDQNPGLRKTEFNLTLNDVVRVVFVAIITERISAEIITHCRGMWISPVEMTRQHESLVLASAVTVESPHSALLAMKCTHAAPYETGTSSPNPHVREPPSFGYLQLLIQYIRGHPPYLQVSVRNLRTRHTVLTVTHVTRSLKIVLKVNISQLHSDGDKNPSTVLIVRHFGRLGGDWCLHFQNLYSLTLMYDCIGAEHRSMKFFRNVRNCLYQSTGVLISP